MIGVIVAIPRRLIFFNNDLLLHLNEALVWYSGIPFLLGLLMIFYEMLIVLPSKKIHHFVEYDNIDNKVLTVVLTAYNDELSISQAVNDFKSHSLVKKVIVVSNNSTDKTLEKARKAGAIVFNEEFQGYGACVYRALKEGVKCKDTDLTLLCEGDMTFRAFDIDKFLSYIPHVDIVNGSRIVEQLRNKDTQLSTFIYYGNFFVAKLLEMKHLGKCSLSDAGTTYKLCRNKSLEKLLPYLDPKVNLIFNSYFLDTALAIGLKIVECPITFHKRVGKSKGGNINDFVAFKVGYKMILGILFGHGYPSSTKFTDRR